MKKIILGIRIISVTDQHDPENGLEVYKVGNLNVETDKKSKIVKIHGPG